MSAIKEQYHHLIERHSRLYNVIELQNMEMPRLIEIATKMNITVGDAIGKQNLIYKILEKQTER